jgi:hypothetical protein
MRNRIPDRVARRILKCCEKSDVVVVVARDGNPSRVFALDGFVSIVAGNEYSSELHPQ